MKEIESVYIEIEGDMTVGVFPSTMEIKNFCMTPSSLEEKEDWRKSFKAFWEEFFGERVNIIFQHKDEGLENY